MDANEDLIEENTKALNLKENRSKIEIKLAAAKRLFMWHFLRKPLDLVLLSEFPKSGGSWLGEMISQIMEIPFPRNKTPKLERCVMHGHHKYSPHFGKMVGILRDGRDVMISAYYHFLFENDRNPAHSITFHRDRLGFDNYDDIQNNLPAFIDYMFTTFSAGKFHLSWSEYVNQYVQNENVVLARYENLLTNPEEELVKICKFLNYNTYSLEKIKTVIEINSFKNKAKREPGQTSNTSFLRKGIAGDWKNHFTKESAEVFNHYAGKELILSNYETSNKWISQIG